MKKLASLFLVFGFAVMLMSFVPQDEGEKPWDIPEEYQNMENPLSVDNQEMVMIGKSLYNRNCKGCHGKDGEGDGPMARRLKAPIDDFTTSEFQDQSDGVIYYQSIIGRDEMPNYEKKIPNEEDRWALITYMRTMGTE